MKKQNGNRLTSAIRLDGMKSTSLQPPEEGDVKDLVQLIRELVPLLENVRNSIEESTNRIPRASSQLSSVTQATENATVEILNTLESMTAGITKAQQAIQDARRSVFQTDELVMRLLLGLGRLVEGAEGREQIASAVTAVRNRVSDGSRNDGFGAADQLLARTKEESMSIAISLQVQDITSQQLAGVAQIIESVRLQLADALDRFEGGMTGAAPLALPATDTTFDTNAEYTRSDARQNAADDIVRQWSATKS